MNTILDEAVKASSVDLYSMEDDVVMEACNVLRHEIARPSEDDYDLEDLEDALERLCAEAVARGLL